MLIGVDFSRFSRFKLVFDAQENKVRWANEGQFHNLSVYRARNHLLMQGMLFVLRVEASTDVHKTWKINLGGSSRSGTSRSRDSILVGAV